MTIEIIAEIGVNHQGDYHTACKLVDAAIAAGCDTAKFQIWNTERVYPRERWDEMKKYELTRHEIESLKKYCDGKGIGFLCTPDEMEDAYFLKNIGVKRIKTSSQDITNLNFLRQIGAMGLPVIMSTGASDYDEVNRAVISLFCALPDDGTWKDITIMHCVSCYPAPIDQMNLRAIHYLRKTFDAAAIGLSDHALGITAALVALGLGATVFEKHLTLDRSQEGPDHAASCSPQQMEEYVGLLRAGEKTLGDGIKRVMPCEMENRKRYEEFIKPRKEST